MIRLTLQPMAQAAAESSPYIVAPELFEVREGQGAPMMARNGSPRANIEKTANAVAGRLCFGINMPETAAVGDLHEAGGRSLGVCLRKKKPGWFRILSFFRQRCLSSCGKLNNKPQTSRGASAFKHSALLV
ncbi:hypothetical protein [Pararhizobium polonicum]|uniref:hypothetical protein n=1 Tax=Pararhizobium polonicum TaxID=1612624 RepID=UPI001111F378|nr:hypothetical protein [Pararhizobium polonicum]